MKTIVLASNNPHKLAELRRMLPPGVTLRSLADIGCHDDIPETSPTLAGNALQKARWVKERYGCPAVLSDDTGLEVDVLGGAPGVLSARYAGPGCSPDDNMRRLLSEMHYADNRSARFVTVLCLLEGDDEPRYFTGEVHGTILRERLGDGGFGYDPVFAPDETPGHSFATLSPDAKNAISHRGRATAAFLEYILSTQ